MGIFTDWLSGYFDSNGVAEDYELKKIELDEITGNPYQPRKDIDEERLQELADSISQYGVITPIQVTRTGEGKYQLIAGERRVRASRMLGREEIPALIRDFDEAEIIEVSFLENLQREPMNPVEIATMYERLRSEFKNMSLEELGDLIGKSPAEIKEYEWILDLSSVVQQAISRKLIPLETAKTLSDLGTEQQKEFISFVVEESPDEELIEEKINDLKDQTEADGQAAVQHEEIEDESLEEQLGIPGELQEREF